MTTALALTAVLALLTWALNRNPGRLAGSTDVEDRDRARVAAELRAREPLPGGAPAGEARARRLSARRAATVRLATGPR